MFNFVSNAKPSLFAYPPPTTQKENRTVEKVDTAVLSTTLKAKLRAKRTEKEKAEKEGGDLMDMDNPPAEEEEGEKMETDEKEEVVEEEPKEKKPKKKGKKDDEPTFEVLANLQRVVPAQLKYIHFQVENPRYVPVKKVRCLMV
jgi:26S proteasome regulatory subunit N2